VILSADTVRSLTDFGGADAPVTSCYLDVDGRNLPTHLDVEKAFDVLTRRAGFAGAARSEVHPSVADDLVRMERHVKGFARSNSTRGIAMFSCSVGDYWEVVELPVRVNSQLVVHHGPYVRPLEEILDEFERFGVLLVDRQHARMFVYELGQLSEVEDAFDQLERQGADARGEMYKTRVESQKDEQVQQHLRRAAQLAFEVFQRQPFDRLIVGGPVDATADLERYLHAYLRERLVSNELHVPVTAPEDQVRRAAFEAEERLQRAAETEKIRHLRSEAAPHGKGRVGLAKVLEALNEHRVERLFVSQGYTAEGWRCPECRLLATIGRRCPACEAEMDLLTDVVEEAVEEALAQHCRVEVCIGNADLDVVGGIGAMLRY
jgi:peptide chain release factor subunit 1